jgi:hypothetical protein
MVRMVPLPSARELGAVYHEREPMETITSLHGLIDHLSRVGGEVTVPPGTCELTGPIDLGRLRIRFGPAPFQIGDTRMAGLADPPRAMFRPA